MITYSASSRYLYNFKSFYSTICLSLRNNFCVRFQLTLISISVNFLLSYLRCLGRNICFFKLHVILIKYKNTIVWDRSYTKSVSNYKMFTCWYYNFTTIYSTMFLVSFTRKKWPLMVLFHIALESHSNQILRKVFY